MPAGNQLQLTRARIEGRFDCHFGLASPSIHSEVIGKSIAHYTITEKIGQGGMGEVYRATDTKLKPGVALKVLPESFTGDPQRTGLGTGQSGRQ